MMLQFIIPFLAFAVCLSVIVYVFVSTGKHTPAPIATQPPSNTSSTMIPLFNTGHGFPTWCIILFILAGFCIVWIPFCLCRKVSVKYSSLKKWLMVNYFYPLKPQPQTDLIELINIKFNAMEYAGCDDLWVGIITNLCDKLEERFGKYRSRVYRSVRLHYTRKLSEISNKKAIRDDQSNKHPRNILIPYYWICLPKFMFQVVITLFIVLVGITLTLFIIYGYFNVTVTWIASFGAITGLVTLSIAVCKFLYYICKSLKSYINRLISNSSSIEQGQGLMHNVKEEVRLLKDMIQFMMWVEQKHFRVVLFVDDLDRCDRAKSLKLLHAVNIILSEPDTPFVSLIAVDPRVMARVIEDSAKLEQTRVNGHEYLKKFIHLPLALPEVRYLKVKKLLELYQPSASDACKKNGHTDLPDHGPVKQIYPMEPYQQAIKALGDGPSYISGNPRTVKRLCNILNLVMRLRYNHLKEESLHGVVKLTWWVVLAELWPYRLSMLVSLLRNKQTDKSCERSDERKLHEVYKENTHVLKSPSDWTSLITLDLEETNFEILLKKYDILVDNVEDFLPYTINLDFSISETFSLAMIQQKIQNVK